jgi:hypothetical protein
MTEGTDLIDHTFKAQTLCAFTNLILCTSRLILFGEYSTEESNCSLNLKNSYRIRNRSLKIHIHCELQ